ncbi:hypothetical protein ACWC09_48170 [Streptomyces sp. NPDC001617]
MHGEPERPTPDTSPVPSPDQLPLLLACALFTLDATSTAARLLGLSPHPGPSHDSSSYARALGV